MLGNAHVLGAISQNVGLDSTTGPSLSSLFCECPHLVGLTQHEVGGGIYVGNAT
jgi:hypothetical protein